VNILNKYREQPTRGIPGAWVLDEEPTPASVITSYTKTQTSRSFYTVKGKRKNAHRIQTRTV